jgi:hypothetical protein
MTEIWTSILKRLEEQLDPKELKTWFAPTRQLSFEPGPENSSLTVSVPKPGLRGVDRGASRRPALP